MIESLPYRTCSAPNFDSAQAADIPGLYRSRFFTRLPIRKLSECFSQKEILSGGGRKGKMAAISPIKRDDEIPAVTQLSGP